MLSSGHAASRQPETRYGGNGGVGFSEHRHPISPSFSRGLTVVDDAWVANHDRDPVEMAGIQSPRTSGRDDCLHMNITFLEQ